MYSTRNHWLYRFQTYIAYISSCVTYITKIGCHVQYIIKIALLYSFSQFCDQIQNGTIKTNKKLPEAPVGGKYSPFKPRYTIRFLSHWGSEKLLYTKIITYSDSTREIVQEKNLFCFYATIMNLVTKVAQTFPKSDKLLFNMQTGKCHPYDVSQKWGGPPPMSDNVRNSQTPLPPTSAQIRNLDPPPSFADVKCEQPLIYFFIQSIWMLFQIVWRKAFLPNQTEKLKLDWCQIYMSHMWFES